MTQVEEIEIGSIGGSGGVQIGKLAVVTREVEVTPEGDQPLELGAMVIAPAEIPFLGVAETVRTVSENVIVTSDDLVTVYKVLSTCIPVASLYAAFGETRTKTCIRILEKIGVVVDDGAGYKCNVAAVQQLVDGVSELCIK
ncbi:MAG: hypothetical protein WC489_07160 [Patescibacteria group bacterium]|jgi:hypothetical protein